MEMEMEMVVQVQSLGRSPAAWQSGCERRPSLVTTFDAEMSPRGSMWLEGILGLGLWRTRDFWELG